MTNKKYHELITPYQDAMSMMIERINLLDHYLYDQSVSEYKSIHHIQSRIKSQKSAEARLKKIELPLSKETAMENLKDIAGIRVVCYFASDIYKCFWFMQKN